MKIKDRFEKIFGLKINEEVLDLTGTAFNKLKEIKGLEPYKNLVKLIIKDTEIREIQGLSHLSKLQILILENNKISTIRSEDLSNLENLKYLNLSGNELTEIKGLDQLSKLKYLDLSNNNISQINGLKKLVNLQILNLSRNKIVDVNSKDFLSFDKLKELYLSQNQIQDIGASIKELGNLEILDLSNNKISKIPMLNNLKKLKRLYLDKNLITEIKNLHVLEKPKLINLKNNPIRISESFMTEKVSENDTIRIYNYCYHKSMEEFSSGMYDIIEKTGLNETEKSNLKEKLTNISHSDTDKVHIFEIEIAEAWDLARKAYSNKNMFEFILRANAAVELGLKKRYREYVGEIPENISFSIQIEALKSNGFVLPPEHLNDHWRKLRNKLAHSSKKPDTMLLQEAYNYYQSFLKGLDFLRSKET